MKPDDALQKTLGDPLEHRAGPAAGAAGLEQYRPYLTILARAQVAPGMRDRMDVSGVIQQTFLEAHQRRGQFRGTGEAETAGWLRRILANNLADAFRAMGRDKRDVGREQSLEQALDQSSVRLGGWLAGEQSSPSEPAHRAERGVLLAAALAEIPEAQREVVMLRHWHGWPLSRVAGHLGRTPAAVAGLLQRALKSLRLGLQELQQRGDL